jgi:hypothetical protein
MWIQNSPLESHEDALEALAAVPQSGLANKGSKVKLTSSETVEPSPVAEPLGVPGWAVAETTEPQKQAGFDGPGISLMAATVIDTNVLVCAAAGAAGSWDWPSLAAIVDEQAKRLRLPE